MLHLARRRASWEMEFPTSPAERTWQLVRHQRRALCCCNYDNHFAIVFLSASKFTYPALSILPVSWLSRSKFFLFLDADQHFSKRTTQCGTSLIMYILIWKLAFKSACKSTSLCTRLLKVRYITNQHLLFDLYTAEITVQKPSSLPSVSQDILSSDQDVCFQELLLPRLALVTTRPSCRGELPSAQLQRASARYKADRDSNLRPPLCLPMSAVSSVLGFMKRYLQELRRRLGTQPRDNVYEWGSPLDEPQPLPYNTPE